MTKAYGAGCPFQMKAEETIRRMDESGRSGQAFLFAIDFEMNEGIFISEPLNQKEILFDVRGQGNAPTHIDTKESKTPVTFIPHPESLETYRHRFDRIRTALMRGDSFPMANIFFAVAAVSPSTAAATTNTAKPNKRYICHSDRICAI